MPEPVNDRLFDALVGELYPLATQAARIVAYLADTPAGIDSPDREFSSRLGDVSAEHVAKAKAVLNRANERHCIIGRIARGERKVTYS